jgi:P27 family predicted phage terminase small subunit
MNMGERGPAPTPSVELAARGSWLAKAREKAGEPVDEVRAPDCPLELSPDAKAHWDFIVPRLLKRRTLFEADMGLLAMMCVEYVEYMSAVHDLRALVESKQKFSGCIVDHPRVRIKGAFDRYSKAAMQFGLSPASKARVSAGGEEKATSKKARFFSGPKLAS